MKNQVPFGAMHLAPMTRWAIHSSRGRRPFEARPNSLTPSAHWTGSPTTFFFSRIAVRKPAAASGRAAIPPAGPAPTTTASYIRRWREGRSYFGLTRSPPRGTAPRGLRRAPSAGIRTGHAPPDGGTTLLRDQLDGHQDPQAVDGRVLGETELLG